MVSLGAAYAAAHRGAKYYGGRRHGALYYVQTLRHIILARIASNVARQQHTHHFSLALKSHVLKFSSVHMDARLLYASEAGVLGCRCERLSVVLRGMRYARGVLIGVLLQAAAGRSSVGRSVVLKPAILPQLDGSLLSPAASRAHLWWVAYLFLC